MNFYRPFFKKLVNLKYVFISSYKIIKFKNKKWLKILLNLKQWLIKNKFNKFKLIDHNKILLNFYSNKFNSYNYNYKTQVICLNNLKTIYFCLLYKKLLKLNRSCCISILSLFERRLDVILIRSKLCLTLRFAKKLILNHCVFINKNRINIKSYILNVGDFIKVKFYSFNFNKYLINSLKWFIPLNNLITNYITKEFLFLNLLNIFNLMLYFPYYLKIKTILYCFYSLMVKQLAVNQYNISSILI